MNRYRLIPGPKRLNLHAIFWNQHACLARSIKPKHFKNGLKWRKPISWVWI
ncbi:L-rhamnose isomerase [Shigella flexneri]